MAKLKTNFFNKKSINIKLYKKTLNPNYIQHMELKNQGWNVLNDTPPKYIRGWQNKSIGIYTPSLKMGKLLINLFFILLPFILVMVLLTHDKDFEFNLFGAIEEFANTQTNNTLDGIENLKDAFENFNKISENQIIADTYDKNNPFMSIYYELKGMGDTIYYLFNLIGNAILLVIYMLGDTISNVIAFCRFIFRL